MHHLLPAQVYANLGLAALDRGDHDGATFWGARAEASIREDGCPECGEDTWREGRWISYDYCCSPLCQLRRTVMAP